MIFIADLQRHLRVPAAKVRKLAAAVLKGEGADRASISFAFLDNDEIRKVNRQFLKHDYATDVLSFLLGEDDLFGEVVISAEYAIGEAKKRKIPAQQELLRYVAHGLLHLLGYDDTTPAKKRVMWMQQERYLTSVFKCARPGSSKRESRIKKQESRIKK